MLARWMNGYRLTAWLVVAVALVVALGTFGHGVDERALRKATRWTVGIGAVFFLGAFVASAAQSLFRAAWSRWLLRNRRYVGLTFASVHFLHAGCFLALGFAYPASFWRSLSLVTLVGGSVGYVWLLAMTITSFDGPTRAVGKRAWRAIHLSGVYVLWVILVFSYLGKAFRSPIYAALVVSLGLALLLRIAARIRTWALRARRANAQ